MSKFLVAQYHQEVEKLIQYGGTTKETAIRSAFQNLLNEYCKPKDYLLIPELDYTAVCRFMRDSSSNGQTSSVDA